MRRRAVRAAALALGLAAAVAAAPSAPAAAPSPPQEARAEDAPLARLRELAELAEPATVVARGLPLVEPGGPLASSGEARALVARALFETGDEARAAALLAAGPDDDAWVGLQRARLALARDELDRALSLLLADGRSLERPRWPDHPESWLLLGRALVRAGRAPLAEPPLARFLERAPHHPEAPSAWHMRMLSAIERGDLALAERCRERSESTRRWHDLLRARRVQALRAPDAPLPRLGIALLWLEAGEEARARALLEELVAAHADFALGHAHLGELHRRAGRAELARRAYDAAVEAAPGEPRALLGRARLARAQGRPADARDDLQALLAGKEGDDPAWRDAHLELARALAALGESEEAAARYARYRALGGEEPLEE